MSLHSNMFGWDYVWRDFADSRGGEIVGDKRGSEGEILAIVVPAENGAKVTFTPTSSGTAAVIDYKATDDFAFNLYREKPLDGVSKMFGMQDIVVGAREFDSHYIIKANNESVLKQILDPKVRDLIMLEDTADLRNLPSNAEFDPRWVIAPGHSAICYNRLAMIDKHDQLKSVYDLLCSIARHLMRLSVH